MCMPYGLTRSFNGPLPIQIMQTDKHVGFLFEMGTWFHVAPFKDAHSADPNPTWFGESIAKWDGDTLVVDTVGFNGWSRLDTRGHPHSDKLHVVQTFRRYDAGHMAYTVTVDDPVYYTKPWKNERTFTLTTGELIEYSCQENNRSLLEGSNQAVDGSGLGAIAQPSTRKEVIQDYMADSLARHRDQDRHSCRPQAYLPLRRADEAQVLRHGTRRGGVGLPEAPAQRAWPRQPGRHSPQQSQLPSHL